MALWVLFFSWTREAREEEAFVPLIFSSPSLSQNPKTKLTKPPLPKLWPVDYHEKKKQRGQAPWAALRRLPSGRPNHSTPVPWLDRGSNPFSPRFSPINTGEERAEEKGERGEKKTEKEKKQGKEQRETHTERRGEITEKYYSEDLKQKRNKKEEKQGRTKEEKGRRKKEKEQGT